MQFSIGVSALQSSQRALEVTGHNIANANTPGYHRQVVQLASADPQRLGRFLVGRGVEVSGVRRIVNDRIEATQIRQASVTGASESQLTIATQLESRLGNQKASPGARLETLFNRLEQLSSQLNSSSARQLAVSAGDQVAREFNSLSNDLRILRDDADQAISEVLAEINPLAEQIAQLNGEISQLNAQNISPNDLLDQRAHAMQQLSERINYDVQEGNQGQATILSDGVPLVISSNALPLEAVRDAEGHLQIRPVGTNAVLSIKGGRLGGFLTAREELLPRYQTRLDELAREVARAFNAVQTTGVGVAGAFTQLSSQQPVSDVNVPLNAAGLPLPPTAGTLTVAVTDTTTGERTLTTLNIDPQQQSLTSVAQALGDIPNLDVFVNSDGGTMTLLAAPGFTFDFRGDGTNPSDSAGLLSALGLNAFFTGGDASTLKLSSDLQSNVDRIATSSNGQAGDSSNLLRLVALRDAPLMPNQTTLTNDFVQTVANIGADVQALSEDRDTNQLLYDRLEEQRQGLSGVDPNEELVNLLKYQRSFQIASKYITVLNETYGDLLAIQT